MTPDTWVMANQAARARGITIGKWLSEAIRQHADGSTTHDERLEESRIFEQLAALDRRVATFEKAVRSTALGRFVAANVDAQDVMPARSNAKSRVARVRNLWLRHNRVDYGETARTCPGDGRLAGARGAARQSG